jgi:hypothetical protein
MKKPSTQNGFIALISILIVSAVLLATTLGLAQFGIANRFFILNMEQKASSKKLAEACVHIARIQTYNDPTFVRSTPLSVPLTGSTCTIVSITPSGNNSTIETSGQTGEAITNLSVVVDNTDGDFLSWEEVPTL